MTTVIGFVQGLFSVLSQLFEWINDGRLVRLGQQQVELAAAQQEITNREKADEIESRPDCTDADTLLDRLSTKPQP